MTLALILISYLQVLFLPGYLYCLYKKKFNLFLIISISIFFNYLIIIFFSNFSFDKQFFILSIICLEILFIFYFILFLEKNYEINFYFDIYKILNFLIIIFILYKLCQYFNQYFGTLFNEGDVLLSWNEWSYNLLGSTYTPEFLTSNNFDSSFQQNQSRSYYGQLIPASWSIFYALTKMTDLTMFPKFLNFFFSFLSILYLIKKYLLKNDIFYIILLFFISYFFFKEHAHFVYSGLVDASLATFIFLSLIHIFDFDHKPSEENLFISILCAAIASNIKMLAFYYSLIFLPIYIFFKYYKIFNQKLFSYLILLFLTSLFWPIYQFIIFENNIFINNNLEYLNSLSVTNFQEGLKRVSTLFGSKIIFILFFFLIFLSLFVKKINIITIFLVIPYLFIWYFFTSYDIRNLLLILPILCLIASFIIVKFLSKFKIPLNKEIFSKKISFNQKLVNKFFFFLVIVSSITFIIFHQSFDKKIKNNISEKKKLIKNEKANNYILNILNESSLTYIYTDYIYLKYTLSSNETNKTIICNMFQKENIDHCYFDKSKNNILVTFYGDELKHKLEYKFEFEFLEKFKNIKVYKIN